MNISISDLKTDELHECSRQLGEVLESHIQWLSNINKTLICQLEPSAGDTADDSYCRCAFGRWFHGSDHYLSLAQSPEFIEIGRIHRDMHQSAAEILKKSQRGEQVVKSDYEGLMGLVDKLRNQIYLLGADLSQELGLVSKLADKIFEHATEGVLITDRQSHILNVNQAFSSVTGYSREDVIGQTPAILRSGRQGIAFYQEMWQSLLEKGHWEGEIWNRKKSGEIYLEWLSISAIRNATGETTHYVSIFSDITEARETEQRLQRLAYHDVLTGLPNRMLFHDRLDQVISAAKRNKTMAALMFLDLDRFKYVNDTMGHKAGDQLLVEVAHRLKGCVRASDTVARLGGDEFTVVLPDVEGTASASTVAQKIIEALSHPFTIAGQDVFISGSIGISIYPSGGKTADALSKNADIAMYRAKELGRNNFQFFRESEDGGLADIFALENHLRRALERNELEVHYQPQVDIETRQVNGVEALLRWNHPQRGMIMPDVFIPLAEQSGLVVPIGEWTLRQACAQNKTWQSLGLPPVRMAVNISAMQLRQRNFAEMVATVLDETGLDAQWLELELTESVVMQNAEEAIGLLKQLKSIGVSLSIDDFGTGYSSLSYLRRFPVDRVKIDKSFIRNVNIDKDNAAISQAIIALANSLNLKVVAEGVEDGDELDFLREHHCCDAQGFYFSRPIDPEGIRRILDCQVNAGSTAALGGQTQTAR